MADEALRIARDLGDNATAADALAQLCWLSFTRGDLETALGRIDEAVGLARATGDTRLTAYVLGRRAVFKSEAGDFDAARADQEEAITLSRAAGNNYRLVISLANLGVDKLLAGDHPGARTLLEEACTLADEHGYQTLSGGLRENLGFIDLLDEEPRTAARHFTASLNTARITGVTSYIHGALLGLALAAGADGDPAVAATLHGIADERYERAGRAFESIEAALRDRDHARLRATLGDAAFEAGCQRGGALSQAEADVIALATAVAGPDPQVAPAPAFAAAGPAAEDGSTGRLSDREREIVALLGPAGRPTARSPTGCSCRSTRCDRIWSGSGTRPAPAAEPTWLATPLRPASTRSPRPAEDWAVRPLPSDSGLAHPGRTASPRKTGTADQGGNMKSIRTTRSAAITLGVMAVLVSGAFTAVAAQAAPGALKAAVSLSASTTTVGHAITASAAKSSVPKGDKLTKITLNWGDGSKAVSLSSLKAKPSHSYAKPGRYTIRLSLTDRHKKTSQATAIEQVAAAPPAGSYSGVTAQGFGLTFYVSSNRTSLQDIALPAVNLDCTPGNGGASSELSIASAAISSKRSFNGTATQSGIWQGFPAKFTYKFSGNFTTVNSAGELQATGTFSETVRYNDGTAHTCSSNVLTWTATRDAQPKQTASRPTTGSYTGATWQGFGLTFYVSSNRTSLQDIALPAVNLDCTPGNGGTSSELSIASAAISSDGSFTGKATQSGVFEGFPATFTYLFRGKFHSLNPAGVLRAAGTFSETITYNNGTAHTCSSDELTWTATRDAQPARQTRPRRPAVIPGRRGRVSASRSTCQAAARACRTSPFRR